MGSSKSSQRTRQTDNRRVLGEGSISAENSTVTVLDNGAISGAFDFSKAIAEGALAFGLKSQADTSGVLADAYENAKGRGALTDYITIGAIAMAGLIAFKALKK